jgi:environmental stress-induced protein Ves
VNGHDRTTGPQHDPDAERPPADRRVVLRARDRRHQVWKNGGGTTSTVLSEPATAGVTDFRWRISIADIRADGPFSTFPGVDRVLTVISPGTVDLTVDATLRTVRALEPFAFSGHAAVHAHLSAGAVRVVNVMARSGRDPRVTVLGLGSRPVTPAAAAGAVLLVVAGAVHIRDDHGVQQAGELDAHCVAAGSAPELRGPATVLAIRFGQSPRPVGQAPHGTGRTPGCLTQ